MTPFSLAGDWALQRGSSPKILERKCNLSVSLSYWLFAKPVTSLSLSAKDHHVTLSALTAILTCKSDLHSLDLISVSVWFCAVESLHSLDAIGMTPRLHQIMPVMKSNGWSASAHSNHVVNLELTQYNPLLIYKSVLVINVSSSYMYV